MRMVQPFWESFKGGAVIRVSKNKERALSLLVDSERKMRSLHQRLEKIGIDGDNANDYVEHCYDLLMQLVRAKLYLDGYCTHGQGAHEVEVSYLLVLKFCESDVIFLDQLRYFRNGVLYYETALDEEYAEKVVTFTKRMFALLIDVVKGSLQ